MTHSPTRRAGWAVLAGAILAALLTLTAAARDSGAAPSEKVVDAKSPEAKSPEAKSPEAKSPEAKSPEGKAEPPPPPVRVLIVTGRAAHDWRASTELLKQTLSSPELAGGRFRVEVIDQPEADLTDERLIGVDVIVFNYRSLDRWPAGVENTFVSAVRDGVGLVVMHQAGSSFSGRPRGDGSTIGNWPIFHEMVGGGWQPAVSSATRPLQFQVDLPKSSHPIVKGLPDGFRHVRDELPRNLKLTDGTTVLATVTDKSAPGGPHPLAWVRKFGEGRVFHMMLGHRPDAMRGAGYQVLLLRGVEWAGSGSVTLAAPGSLDAPEDVRR